MSESQDNEPSRTLLWEGLPELSDAQAYAIFYTTPFLHVGVKDASKSKK